MATGKYTRAENDAREHEEFRTVVIVLIIVAVIGMFVALS